MTDEITGEMPAEDAIASEVTPEPTGITEEPTEDVESSTTPADDHSAAPKKNKVQERIDELTKARREAEREAEYWRQQVEARKQQEIPKGEPVKPTLESVGYDEAAYDQALEKYVSDRAAFLAHQEQLQAKQREQAVQREKLERDFSAKSVDFASKTPDYFHTVNNPELRITNEMAEAIKESNNGPEVAYYLGKNPDLSAQIASLSPYRQYMEIGRIQAELAARKPIEAEISKAPPPIKPASSKNTVTKDPSRMTDDEFRQWRLSMKKRR